MIKSIIERETARLPAKVPKVLFKWQKEVECQGHQEVGLEAASFKGKGVKQVPLGPSGILGAGKY